jgi:hypothetical protein
MLHLWTMSTHVNPCDQFVTMVTKWEIFFAMVMNANLSLHIRCRNPTLGEVGG